MNHRAVRRRLSALLDRALPPDERRRAEAHLAACAACRDELDALRRTLRLLREVQESAPPPAPPAALTTRAMQRIRAGEDAPSLWQRVSQLASGPGVFAWSGVALSLLLALIFVQRVEIEINLPVAAASDAAAPASEVPSPVAPPPAAGNGATASTPPPQSAAAETRVATASPREPVTRAQTSAARSPLPLRRRCAASPDSPNCLAWKSQLLGLALANPRAFLSEVEALPAAARERWLVELSRSAARRGSAARIAARLRASGDARALHLAPHFDRASFGEKRPGR